MEEEKACSESCRRESARSARSRRPLCRRHPPRATASPTAARNDAAGGARIPHVDLVSGVAECASVRIRFTPRATRPLAHATRWSIRTRRSPR